MPGIGGWLFQESGSKSSSASVATNLTPIISSAFFPRSVKLLSSLKVLIITREDSTTRTRPGKGKLPDDEGTTSEQKTTQPPHLAQDCAEPKR
ncbi:hypothetical protein ZWY2020_014250 [Hordeum vulgare]|nr:hypothetical protein ZWY2020_014250 [Hordeum vulgare]